MRTSQKGGRGGSWGGRPSAQAAVAPAPRVITPVHTYRLPASAKSSLGALILRSLGWFVLLVAMLGGILVVWRHMHGHESASATATFVVSHETEAALGLLLAALVGAMLVTSTRARAQALGFLAVVVLGTGAVGGFYVYGIESLQGLKADSKQVKAAQTLLDELGSPDDPAIALIAGYDHRAGTGTNAYAGSNSDTLMLLRADPNDHTLSLLSFPRDLNVPIYCKGNTISTYDRVNAAWADCGANGGPRAALDTIKHLAGGININFLITLDFNAFQQVVNRLGGVYLNVDRRYYNENVGTYETNYANIDLHPGYQRLNGADALSYVRFRHLDSDIYRNGRQQLFMEALKARLKSALSLTNITEITGIVSALKGNLEIAKADGSAPTPAEVNSYLGLLIGLPAGHLFRNAIPPSELSNYDVGGAAELQASPEAIAAAVHRFLHPVVPVVHDTHKKGNGTKTPSLPHKDISVLVLNAGYIAGEAADTSYKLGKHGFATKVLPKGIDANAPKKTRNTTVYYDPSQDKGLKAAQELAPLFGSHHRVTQMTPRIAAFAQKANGTLTVVAIGTAYRGNLKLRNVSKPSRSTSNAQVTSGISLTLPAVRSENGPAHFPLMFPKKVALGSSLSTEEGVRLFKPLRGIQELVLTFNLYGGIEYWQIEESNWPNPPLLDNPTHQFRYHGRTYYEYTSGGALQRVAVRVGKSVYWVQNTILNSLSNSTMIAIAEGLQPLH